MIEQYKNPYDEQYVAPEGMSFFRNGKNVGRIIWTSSPEEYVVKKDDNG